MPADANIFQQYLKPPESVLDYQAAFDQADARKNALAQSVQALQKGQMDLSNAADVNRQRTALRAAVSSGQLDLSNPAHAQQALAIAPDVAPALLKTVQDSATSRALASKDTAQAGHFDAQTAMSKLDQSIKAHDFHLQELGAVANPQAAQQWAVDGLKSGVFTPEQFAAGFAKIPTDPAGFQQWKQQAMQGGATATEQLKMQQQQLIADNANKTHIQTTGMTNATSRANNRDTIAGENLRAGVNADGSAVDSGGLLSKESVINAAARYNTDGTLPPNLGRGTQGPRQTAQILNEAARQAAERGDTPQAQRIAQLANKASSAALTKVTTQEAQVGAFEKNFNKNADLAIDASSKVDRTGVPIVNKWINAGKRAVTGDPDLAVFDTAVKATVNEYSKIVSGATGNQAATDGEIKHINELLNAAQKPEQVVAVINFMKKETGNRMTSFADQKKEIQGNMIQEKSKAAPASATIPPDIATILQKHGGK
jgi:hypothetical protein